VANSPINSVFGTPENAGETQSQSGTSIFDPVICELAYRWFSPPDGAVLDPFAGGSVRGIVAALLGRKYTGIDLSERQVEANRAQALDICADKTVAWVVGDAKDAKVLAQGEYDFILTCPPYADLERYSDDPRDLSTMDYAAFITAYRAIIADCADMLKPDRFACIVVGDIRDKRGNYRNFVADTIAAFRDTGMSLYNEAVLVTAVGSLPIRAGKQFSAGRKLGKTHQNVLVFLRGDAKRATEACGEVDVALPEEMSDDGRQ
jgi:DNA modification methylase